MTVQRQLSYHDNGGLGPAISASAHEHGQEINHDRVELQQHVESGEDDLGKFEVSLELQQHVEILLPSPGEIEFQFV